MLKSPEYSNCHEPLSQNGYMGDIEPPNNMLHKAKHTSSSIPGWVLSSYIHIARRNPPMKLLP